MFGAEFSEDREMEEFKQCLKAKRIFPTSKAGRRDVEAVQGEFKMKLRKEKQ